MPDKYRFYLGNSTFSIYEEMSKVLQEERSDGTPSKWTLEKNQKKMNSCHLILGDRFDIPYTLLNQGVPKMVNYFRGSHKLTLKASMARSMRQYVPESAEWMPLTFVLGGKKETPDDREVMRTEMEERPETNWIIKPSAGCGGQGIMISKNLEEILTHVETTNTEGKSLFVVQKYVDRPLLLEGRKFDVRVWVLVAHPFCIYQFSEGSCRMSSVKYNDKSFDAMEAHITNHCLQQSSADYGKYEDGNELWYADLDRIVEKEKGVKYVADQVLKPQFANICKHTLLSIKEVVEVVPGSNYTCFQLFGFDFLVDDDLKVHLLEINGSPGAAEKWLNPIVRGMVDLCIEPQLPASTRSTAEGTRTGAKWEHIWSPPQ